MERLAGIPPVKWAMTHPRIAAWVVLSVGMVVLLVIEARNVGLSTTNWISLIVATVLVAGACIWIVSWEDVDDTEQSEQITPALAEDPKPKTDDKTASPGAASTEPPQETNS